MHDIGGDQLFDMAGNMSGNDFMAMDSDSAFGMFEAIHGSAPRMVQEGRAQYADPSSMIRASAMMLSHINFSHLGDRLHKALDICQQYECKLVMTGRDTGASSREYGDYVLETMRDPNLTERWQAYVNSEAKGSTLQKSD